MTPDSIRAHQHGIYTVCLHVLGHPQDAEDAAQEALLKIASEAGGIRDPRAFKSWIYRVTYRTAVDHLRKRATRRRIEEGSVPMTPSLTDQQREAIHEAMAALPDDDRLLLVEHYFEKSTLEEMGRREGVSDVAMGKRVEKAREKLKRGLAGAGILIGIAQVADALESVSPATAPIGLIGSKAALAAAGGATVATKSGTAVKAVVVVLILLGIGGGVFWWSDSKSARGTEDETSYNRPEARLPSDVAATHPASGVQAETGLQTCRSLISRVVTRIRSSDLDLIAWDIRRVHDGQMPVIEDFIQEFMSAAGDRLIPFSRQLLAETQSDSVRLLITIALGRSGDPATFELLKGFVAEESSVAIRASALYSVGLLKTPGGFDLIRSLWEKIKSEGGPLGQPLMLAISLQDQEGLDWALGELKNSNLEKILSFHGNTPWSFNFEKGSLLSFFRSKDTFGALQRIHESEPDPALRLGAAKGMLSNFDSTQLDYLADLMSSARDGGQAPTLVVALRNTAKSAARTALVDRVLGDMPYPTGNADLDRAILRLAQIASPEKAASLFERFISEAAYSKDEYVFWNAGAIFIAVAGLPDADKRMAALMKSCSFSAHQQETIWAVGLWGATPETVSALSKPVLAMLQVPEPNWTTFGNCIQPLMLCGLDERILSSALQAMSDLQSDPANRMRILQELAQFTGGSARRTREITIPRTYLESVANQARDPETLLYSASCLASTGTDALSRWRGPIGEWIGRDMRWTEHVGHDSFLTWIAPQVIGDYYARFGTEADIAWLKDLPDRFPFPALWEPSAQKRVRSALKEESRRAIDAIRLRN